MLTTANRRTFISISGMLGGIMLTVAGMVETHDAPMQRLAEMLFGVFSIASFFTLLMTEVFFRIHCAILLALRAHAECVAEGHETPTAPMGFGKD